MAYTLTGERCGTVRFIADRNGTINGETFTHSSKVTQNPIESGGNINDHVFRNPASLQLKGTVIGGQDAHDRLIAMWKRGDIVTYSGRVRVGNLVITNLSENYSPKNRNGFDFTATFQVVSFGSAEYAAFGTVPMMSPPMTLSPAFAVAVKSHFFSRSRAGTSTPRGRLLPLTFFMMTSSGRWMPS